MTMRLFASAIILTALFWATPAEAHVLESNGPVGAVMHISPDDDPVAGERSDFFFELKDKEGKFRPEDCECRVSISESGVEIFGGPLYGGGGLESAAFSFTFPKKGIYEVKISGNPKNGNSFSAFGLKYGVRVDKASEKSPVAAQGEDENWFEAHIIHLLGGLTLAGFLVFALIKQNRKKIAAIILALFLIGHSLPVKAIHAAHTGVVGNDYSCCLPSAAVIPQFPVIGIADRHLQPRIFINTDIAPSFQPTVFLIRAPPLS